MKKFNRRFRNNLFLLALCPAWLHADTATGRDYELDKCLVGGSGASKATSADYNGAYAVGEDVTGVESQSVDYDFVSGYFSSNLSSDGLTGGIDGSGGSVSNVFVFPIPWRPFGPGAGTAIGQTGTESSGLTFANLPSECTIKIYTLNGELVRELDHTDLIGPLGQEKWDGNTSGGHHAASGVYLWRAQSPAGGKIGKLMLIR